MNTKTAKKELRKSQRRNYANNLKKNNVKKIKRKLLAAFNVQQKSLSLSEGLQKNLSNYNSLLAKMAKSKVIHPNKASRLVSRMSKKASIAIAQV